MLNAQMIRRKFAGLILHLWPQLLADLEMRGWEAWVDRLFGLLPMLNKLLGLNLSLPPGNWRESLPEAAVGLVNSLPDETLIDLVEKGRYWLNWLADPTEGGGAGGSDSAE